MPDDPWSGFEEVGSSQGGGLTPVPLPAKPADAPSGYRWDNNGGLAAIPGGPADKPESGNAPPSGYRWTGNGGLEPIPGGPADKGPEATGNNDAVRVKLLKTVGYLNKIAKDANDNGGWFETGTSGNIGRNIPMIQTAGKDLAANLNTLNSSFAFDALQAMRDASKTGGALGSVSERELELLQASVANLDPNQSHQQFLDNIEIARQAYLSKLAVVDPQMAARLGYNAQNAEAALIGLNDAYNKEFGINEPVAIDRTASAAPQGNPQDIDAIMAKYGVQ